MMGDDAITIGPLPDDQVEASVGVLARAFQDDPLFVAMFPDARERARAMLWVARWNLRHAVMFGTVLTTGANGGVAIAYRSDASVYGEEQLAASLGSMPERPDRVDWDRYDALQAAWTVPDEELAAAIGGPHWYLDMIAVEPDRQGRGIGGALLRAFHGRADADGLPTGLFIFQPRNLPLYERHGYTLVRSGTEPAAWLAYWCFCRPTGALA